MTPEERAVQVCLRLAKMHGRSLVSIATSRLIAEALRAVQAEEREACAALVPHHVDDFQGRPLIDAIRARGNA